MKTYQIQLLNCNNHNIEISKYLQIMTEIPKEDADQIVSNVPVVLYENLDEECTGYFETALDYYQAEYKILPMPEECTIPKFPSRQVIVLGRVVDYPFSAKDGITEEEAVKLCQEFTNMGIRAQIVRSKKI